MTQRIDRRGLLGAGLAGAAWLAAPHVARAAAPEVINIAFFVETKPTMAAKGQGWFEREAGARINWVEVGSGAEINTAIAAGSIDVGIGIGSSPTAAGISQGIGYELIGMLDNIGPAEEMTVRKSADIRAPADFKGRKVGVPFGSTSHFRLLGFLKQNGLSESDVTVLDLRPDALVAAWSRGDIDAAYVWSPAKARMLADGGEAFRTYDALDAAGYVIADLIVARSAFVAGYPDAVAGVLRAAGQGLALWQSQPDQAAAIVGQQTGVSAATALAEMKEYDFVPLADQLKPDWLGPPGQGGRFDDVLKRTADFLVEQKSIRRAPGAEAFRRATNTAPLAKAVG